MFTDNQNPKVATQTGRDILSGIPISDLRNSLRGQVITSADAEYDQSRTVFYGGIDRRPALIIKPANAADVASVVMMARDRGLELAIRGGGHSVLGHSVSEGGIVLDLSGMRALAIDTDNQTAWAEAGLTAGEYTTRTGEHGLATGFGDTGSVGIGGITLGGGVGYLVRKYGLTIDSLLGAEIITADGRLLNVDEESHPDLFWALRGGGGNFGVVTRFKFRLHPVDRVLGGMLILPATPEVVAGFIAESEAAPEELSTIANVMTAPPMPFLPPAVVGKVILMALLVYAGDLEEGQKAVAPLRALATPLADMIRPMRYPEIYPPEDPSYHPTAVGQNLFLERVDQEVAAMMIDRLQSYDAPLRAVQLRALGGAMARVPQDATAFAHRQRRIMANLAAFYTGPEDKAARAAWVADFASALDQGVPGAYVNFLTEEGPARTRAAYPGPTFDRLAQVKARYDPSNFFRLNHNIPPANGG